jgi:hypothetical protein
MTYRLATGAACVLAAALALSACGGGGSTSATTATAAKAADNEPPGAPTAAQLAQAEHPVTSAFPAAGGKSLTALSSGASEQAQLGLSTGTFLPGTNRFGFALVSKQRSLFYGPTVLYVAKTPTSPARGPFPAPIDPMIVPPQFRSKNAAAGPDSIEAIYSAHVPVAKPGNYFALALSRVNGKVIGATTPFIVQRHSPIPAVGEKGPAIDTLTPADVNGDLSKITTRIPPEAMNNASFKDVVGKKPVVLMFSTPALCQSRVCGPVTDIGVYMQHQFGSKVAFIHQEVYVDNNPQKGLRPQLTAYHLQTEPWLFTFDKRGRIAARIEGAFGINEFRQAVQAALKN